MDIVLRIRGIYATALTKFFLDQGLAVALPSGPIAERFRNVSGFDVLQAPDVDITDLDSKHGVLLEGEKKALEGVVSRVRDCFHDAVMGRRAEDVLEIEFPLPMKLGLDEIRNRVLPTLLHHHRLKIIDSDAVDSIEKSTLAENPQGRGALGAALEKAWIWDLYERGKPLAMEHVKVDGRVLHLSQGEIMAANYADRSLVLRRSKFKGGSTYDGLNAAIKEGDFAVTQIREGEWHYGHAYFRRQGERIGAYYNINTPVEFYPDRIRYVDLEIDVVHFPDGRVEVVDEGELAKGFEQGHLTAKMVQKAVDEASRLKKLLKSHCGPPGLGPGEAAI